MEDKSRILIISNNKHLDSMNYTLHSRGYNVTYLENDDARPEKVAYIKPDVVIIDVTAGISNWLDFIRRLKKQDGFKAIPIVVLTTIDEKEYRLKALTAGVDDFLLAPIDEAELQARIVNLIKVEAYNKRMLDFEKDISTEVERRTHELSIAFEKVKIASLDTVYRLSRAAEYRDDDVGTHIERMSHYATAIARAMKLDDGFVENILWASPMHDVGKIGIPDSILRKPAKLDENEWLIMKQHTTIGSEILKDSTTDFIKLAGEIALSHHEKWDGSGYPKGLKGPDIPLAGRIVAIADVFDALTSARPYKEPFSLDEALKMIKDETETHFDPSVTGAFLSIQDEIVKEFNFWQFMSSDSSNSDSETNLSDLFES